MITLGEVGAMNELALFAGAGGGILGGKLLGWRTVCAVEIDAYCAGVLVQRQNDGILPAFPIWDDVRSFDGKPWRGIVDVVSGGFPCQDISCAGKGAGIEGERSGLWKEFARIIGEVGPRYVFVENTAALVVRGFGRVLGDLAALGYDAEWGVLGARDVGAPHRRERIWIVADADSGRFEECMQLDGAQEQPEQQASFWNDANGCDAALAHSDGAGPQGRNGGELRECAGKLPPRQSGAYAMVHAEGNYERAGLCEEEPRGEWRRRSGDAGWWESEPELRRMVDGLEL